MRFRYAVILLVFSVWGGLLDTGPQSLDADSHPVVVTVRVRNGKTVYKLDGKVVENSARNSLITNLTKILVSRGREAPVWVVVDVRAPFSEVGKIETALDKVNLPNRRFFVTNFTDDMANELHWDAKPVRIPRN
jgi:hypothetical protein